MTINTTLIMQQVASGSEQGQMINKCRCHCRAAAATPYSPPLSFIKDGKIVPVEVTVSLLSKAIFSSPSWNFLVDGFPRNMDNFNGWFDAIGDECDVSACPRPPSHWCASHRGFTGPIRAVFHVSSECHGAAAEAKARVPPPPSLSQIYDVVVPLRMHFQRPLLSAAHRHVTLAHRSETSGRVDDNWQSMLKRFTVFEKVQGFELRHRADTDANTVHDEDNLGNWCCSF
jgi:hypothetical protein